MELRFAFPRVYGMLSFATLGAFVLTGSLFALWPEQERAAPDLFQPFTASVPVSWMQGALSAEIPDLAPEGTAPLGTIRDWAKIAGPVVLGLDPSNLVTWFSSTLPGFTPSGALPADPNISGHVENPGTPDANPQDSSSVGQASGAVPDSSANGESSAVAGKLPLLFIYQSHNRESWLPELKGVKDPDKAFDAKTNVTLLGTRLKEQLAKQGVLAMQSTADYETIYDEAFLKSRSYAYSKKIVQEALATTPSLKYLIDIHRDSGPRKGTTVKINGKDYAKIFFVVGLENPHWKENQALALKLQSLVNAKYPGISRGIDTKDHTEGNGVYNQDLSPNSALIEIGGVENTLEECDRTVDALAAVLAEMIKADAGKM